MHAVIQFLYTFYSYIYTEKAKITASNAGPLMFAAKKYLITGLSSACLEVLGKSIGPDTVCTILEHVVLFGEDNLKEKCLAFISANADLVLNTDAFMNMSHDVLKVVVGLKALCTSEKQVFESCVRWAKHQLLESGNESPTDEEIRQQLGSVLYEIRFPTMTAEEFAKLTAHSQILTEGEKNGVFVYIATKEKLGSFRFVADSRANETVIKRFTVKDSGQWNCNSQCDAISFETTVTMSLAGVGLYGGVQESTHDVTLTLLKDGTVLSETKTKMTSSGSKEPIKVRLERPVVIPAKSRHVVAVTITGPQTWSGLMVVGDFEASGKGKITFYDTSQSTNGTCSTSGQIPELYVMWH